MPQVSVLMPVYNGERHLVNAIRSILWQTWRDWELLIIDDGSQDGSLSCACEFAARDKRLRVISLKHRGIVDALNDVNAVRLKYLSTTPEFDKKILVLFPNSLEKSRKYNNLREVALRVPDDILVGLVNKFEQPSQEVLDLVDEVIEVEW